MIAADPKDHARQDIDEDTTGRATTTTTTTTTNTAIWFRQFGPPLQTLTLEKSEDALPTPLQPNQIRVRMICAPINPSDLIPITGAYRHSVQPPQIAGYEGVGTVIEAGTNDAARRLLGRRILPLRGGSGTWQTSVDCDAAWAVPVPDDVPHELAARAYINPLAAHLMLRRWGVQGKRVLLTGAGSACAALLAQWAQEAGAAEVTRIHRSPTRKESLLQLRISPIHASATEEILTAARQTDIVFDATSELSSWKICPSPPSSSPTAFYPTSPHRFPHETETQRRCSASISATASHAHQQPGRRGSTSCGRFCAAQISCPESPRSRLRSGKMRSSFSICLDGRRSLFS